MKTHPALATMVLAATACTQVHLGPGRNVAPTIELLAPTPDYGRVPANIDLVIEALAIDLDDYAVNLSASLFMDDVLLDESVPDETGLVTFDWRTPSTPGPVDIMLVITDESTASGVHVESFWVQ